jgi:hypothetical protein
MGSPDIPPSSQAPAAPYIPPHNQGPSTAGKAGRTTAGARDVKTPPQPAGPEPKTIPSSPDTANATEAKAEAAVNELEDARASLTDLLDLLKDGKASPTQLDEATGRIVSAQKAADEAVENNVKVQKALDDASRPASRESLDSGPALAVALNLRDIAKGTRPGRNELARNANLDRAKWADDQIQNAHAGISNAVLRGDMDIKAVERGEKHLRDALSTDWAEWAALHDKAVTNNDRKLRKMSEFKMESDAAEMWSAELWRLAE